MSVTTASDFDTESRATLAALADVLVPEAEGMPAASQVDVHGKWVDRVLRVRPDLVDVLSRVLGEARGRDPVTEVARLQQDDPDGFAVLALAVTGAYYLNPRIRKRIGYPGQKSNPPYPDEADYYLRDGLVGPVTARGPIYRPTPSAE
jgi:hypothetical protein